MNEGQSVYDPIDGATLAKIAAALTKMGDDEDAGFTVLAEAIVASPSGGREFGAVRNLGTWWAVIVTEAGDTLDDAATSTIAVNADREVVAGPWDNVRRAGGLILDRNASFVGEFWLEWFDSELIPPFHLDAGAWEGAVYGADESTFNVTFDGDKRPFQAVEHCLWGTGPPAIRSGTWLSMSGEYAAASVVADTNGCLWGHMVESGTIFLGRPSSEDPSPADNLSEVTETLFDGGEFEISELSSDFLTIAELVSHIALVRSLDPNFDADSLTVSGIDGTVMAAEITGVDDSEENI